MNVAEFELALGNPPLSPKSMSAFQTLTHQIEYTPEDFVAYMSRGSNGSYSVNKQKVGATSYKYYIFSLTGGYYNTVVSDQMQTGGNNMKFPEIPAWATEAGKDIVMYAVSGFVMGFAATFVAAPTNWADFTNAIYGASVFGFYQAVKSVAEYIKTKATKNTKAGNLKAAPKPLLKRML